MRTMSGTLFRRRSLFRLPGGDLLRCGRFPHLGRPINAPGDWLQQAINNQRQAWNTLAKMHRITLDYMWQKLPNTSRRKRLSKTTLGLD